MFVLGFCLVVGFGFSKLWLALISGLANAGWRRCPLEEQQTPIAKTTTKAMYFLFFCYVCQCLFLVLLRSCLVVGFGISKRLFRA